MFNAQCDNAIIIHDVRFLCSNLEAILTRMLFWLPIVSVSCVDCGLRNKRNCCNSNLNRTSNYNAKYNDRIVNSVNGTVIAVSPE